MVNADLIIGVSTLIIASIVWFASRGLSLLGGMFVNYTLIAMAFLSVVVLVKGLIKPEKLRIFESAIERNNVLLGLVILFLYITVMPYVGFLSASYAFYAVFNWYLGDDRMNTRYIVISCLLSFIVVSTFYMVFQYVLNVPLPKGTLFET